MPPDDETGWISAAEAARRLGVRRETVYAYVSRGMLTSRPVPGRRETRFDPAEVALLARRGRSGGPSGRGGRLELVVDSALTLLDPAGRLAYRGWDVVEASRGASFEEVAMWLWGRTASDSGEPPAAAFVTVPEQLAAARAAAATAGPTAEPVDRFLLMVAAAGAADP